MQVRGINCTESLLVKNREAGEALVLSPLPFRSFCMRGVHIWQHASRPGIQLWFTSHRCARGWSPCLRVTSGGAEEVCAPSPARCRGGVHKSLLNSVNAFIKPVPHKAEHTDAQPRLHGAWGRNGTLLDRKPTINPWLCSSLTQNSSVSGKIRPIVMDLHVLLATASADSRCIKVN